MTLGARVEDLILAAVEDCHEELVAFAADLIRIPTVNPPGALYRDCAERIGRTLEAFEFEVDYVTAVDRPEHTTQHPRTNVLGLRRGRRARPLGHLNGHFDVVPAGEGWTVDPFGGVVRDGKLWGRGAADMKGGLAAAIYAAEALRRAGVELEGSIEISGTVDEESGGFAGVAHLAEIGRLSAQRTDQVIIPEPLDPDRICIGHRGVYWFKVTAHGRIAHGSMPFLGTSAIDQMGALLEAVRTELGPRIAERTTAMPIVPPQARRASINTNAVLGGQAGVYPQTPCVADRCEAIFDRRFLMEEGLDATRAEIAELLERVAATDPAWRLELTDLMTVHPTQTPADAELVKTLERAVERVLGRRAELVASPGTYDHKHVARIAGIEQCVAYGPGRLEQAHLPDEWCSLQDLLDATKVMALSVAELLGARA